jgi:hypothetical protein
MNKSLIILIAVGGLFAAWVVLAIGVVPTSADLMRIKSISRKPIMIPRKPIMAPPEFTAADFMKMRSFLGRPVEVPKISIPPRIVLPLIIPPLPY